MTFLPHFSAKDLNGYLPSSYQEKQESLRPRETMMSQQSQALVQDIGERMKAADLIESRQLLQYTAGLKADYLLKPSLMPRKSDYLDIAHLLPVMPLYGGAGDGGGRESEANGRQLSYLLADSADSYNRSGDGLRKGYKLQPLLELYHGFARNPLS